MENSNIIISNIKSNIMGTTSFDLLMQGMRKPQGFIVYPLQKGEGAEVITIQSDKRIGKIDLSTGKGLMSQNHAGGAYLIPFQLTGVDLSGLKMHIFASAGSAVGTRHVLSDNSQAVHVLSV